MDARRFRVRLALMLALLAAAVAVHLGCRRPPPAANEGRGDGDVTILPESSRRALDSLPYATWSRVSAEEARRVGVTRLDPQRVSPGLNLVVSRADSEVELLDLEGETVHTWRRRELAGDWHHAHLCRDGDLLVVVKDRRLARLDWDSNLLWDREARVHHDVAEAADGNLFALSRADAILESPAGDLPVLDDRLLILSASGEVVDELSLGPFLQSQLPASVLSALERWEIGRSLVPKIARSSRPSAFLVRENSPGDLYHTNSVQIVPRTVPGFAAQGDLLIAVRNLNLVATVDLDNRVLGWQWGPGRLVGPHHPTLVDNGHLLIFDNGDRTRPYSRVLELDPQSGEVVWQFIGEPPERFFSSWGGSAQRLPNGNTLITDTDSGHVIERTPDGEVVWEYFSAIRGDREREALYRVTRIADSGSSAPLAELLRTDAPR